MRNNVHNVNALRTRIECTECDGSEVVTWVPGVDTNPAFNKCRRCGAPMQVSEDLGW